MDNRAAKLVSLFLLLLFSVFLLLLFISRCYYQQALRYAELGDNDKALSFFDRADNGFSLADHQRINTQRAKTLLEWGENCRETGNNAQNCYSVFKTGRHYAALAVKADPLDYLPAYLLARTEAELEFYFPEVQAGRSNPYRAEPLFQKAFRLRPNGVTIHYDYIMYLYHLGQIDAMAGKITDLLAIYPEAYDYIKKAPFFSQRIFPFIKAGLIQALENNRSPDRTLSFLIDISLQEGDDWQAIMYYLQKMEIPSSMTKEDFLQMGRLYLRIGLVDKSFGSFQKAIDAADSIDPTVQLIYTNFCEKNHHESFIRFAGQLEESGLNSLILKRSMAKSLMETGRLTQAREILHFLAEEMSDPVAFYLLARIARQQEEWGEMELAAQKAVVLDKTNPYYLLLFAEALQNQKKYLSAEEVVTTIIDSNMPVGSLGYARRGMIRWQQGNDMGAIEDWRQAFTLADESDKSFFLYYISRAYYRQGFVIEAWKTINRALETAPDNDIFLEWKKTVER